MCSSISREGCCRRARSSRSSAEQSRRPQGPPHTSSRHATRNRGREHHGNSGAVRRADEPLHWSRPRRCAARAVCSRSNLRQANSRSSDAIDKAKADDALAGIRVQRPCAVPARASAPSAPPRSWTRSASRTHAACAGLVSTRWRRSSNASAGNASAMSRLTVLAGPTAVGKGTVVHALREREPDVWISVSATTRAPRPGEIEGVHYFFVTAERFDEMIAGGELLEWAVVHGVNRYGTPARGRGRVTSRRACRCCSRSTCRVRARCARPCRMRCSCSSRRPRGTNSLRGSLGVARRARTSVSGGSRRAKLEMAAESEFDAVIVNDTVEAAAAELERVIESTRASLHGRCYRAHGRNPR